MHFFSCILADGVTTQTTGLQGYVVNFHIWNDNDAKSCIAVWIYFFSFLLAKVNSFLFAVVHSGKKTKPECHEISCNDMKKGGKILTKLFEYIWKTLFNLVDSVLSLSSVAYD